MQITDILRGPGGNHEFTRVLGAAGVAVYILAANVFEAWTIWGQGKSFDVVSYCAAFPTGLGVAIAAVATAAAHKDKTAAVAQVTRETGTMPVPAPPSAS